MIHDNAKRSARFCILKGIGMNMIKGVGRYAIEVESVDSEFFERVICFVRPQYACGSALDLHREAARMADDLSAEVEDAQHGTRHVLRVTSRIMADPSPIQQERTRAGVQQELRLVYQTLEKSKRSTLTQSLMELGATVCIPKTISATGPKLWSRAAARSRRTPDSR